MDGFKEAPATRLTSDSLDWMQILITFVSNVQFFLLLFSDSPTV